MKCLAERRASINPHVPFLLGLGDEVVWAEGFGVKLQEVLEYVKVSSQIWIVITTI